MCWLQCQLNDLYVKCVKVEGYCGCVVFKILEFDEKYWFFVFGVCVVDLGCVLGGWCQVVVKCVNVLGEKLGKKVGIVLGVDL